MTPPSSSSSSEPSAAAVAGSSASPLPPPPQAPVSGYKGRPRADMWELFTESPNPQRLLSCVCRHCGVEVVHRKKSERAKAHLAKRCPPFRTLMLAIEDPALRPEWFNELCERRRPKSDASTSAVASASTKRVRLSPPATPSPQPAPTKADASVAAAASIASAASAAASGSRMIASRVTTAAADKPLQLLAATAPSNPRPRYQRQQQQHQQRQVQRQVQQQEQQPHPQQFDAASLELAMHFYATGTPFARVEDPFLLRAFRALVPHAVLPTRAQLAGELLDACFDNVQAAVARAAAAARSSNVHESESALATGASAVVQACARVIKELFTPCVNGDRPSACAQLALFVQDCSALVDLLLSDAALRSELEHEQRALGSKPLSPLSATTPWSDLKRWLDSVKSNEDIVYELVTSHEFVSTRSAQHARIHDIVTGGGFFEDLDKSIQLLEPIHATIVLARAAAQATGAEPGAAGTSTATAAISAGAAGTAAAAASVPISNAYHSLCVTMHEAYDKMRNLSSAERTHVLTVLNSERLAVASASDAGVAYLLDPRYLGAGMESDERYRAEDHLFDFFHRSASSSATGTAGGGGYTLPPSADELERQKEALFQEYTAFVIKSRSVRQHGGFRYQMLIKGTKTIHQFWLTDGHQFPLLQQVALAVFAPASAAVATAVGASHGTSAKLAAVGGATRSFADVEAALQQQFTTPVKGAGVEAAATGASASPGVGVTPSPGARRSPPVLRAQLDKLAYIQAHAAVLLHDNDGDDNTSM